jgi:hypothetical protein
MYNSNSFDIEPPETTLHVHKRIEGNYSNNKSNSNNNN